MDNTLDSIHPSSNRTQNTNLSFIYGRDPSILAYGQIHHPHEESKKNLESLFEDNETVFRGSGSSVPSLSSLGDTIKVYLRLRPFPPRLKLNQQQQEAYQIINANTLLTKLPSLDSNSSSLKRPKGSETVSRKFTFTSTFGPETSQLQLFEQAVKQAMTQFLNGQSATVMSYGTTNAGKSYTLQGTTASPGIIPRGLEFVFCNINPRATPCYKPLYNTEVVSLDTTAKAYEMELKTKLLSFGSIDKNQYIQAYRDMQQLLQDESPLKPSETSDANYSVWVSFAEIYNETVFDLLSNDCQKKRPALKLSTDSNGKAFIRNLKMVCVNSGSEAYQLLMAGQYNLKVAATALNARSSRSHCIFTIKLLKYHKENSPADVEVSTFSFCDLAGSERLKKTLNAGERLKEAQNINTSLMVLGRCLKSIYEVQSSKLKHEVVGPFRESKLTRLFQSALSGKEHIALIVNVNPVPTLYVETQNVLNFSAIAKQIVVEPVARKRRASRSRFSQLVSQSVTTVTDWDLTDLESIGEEEPCRGMEGADYVHVDDYDEVVKENEKLKAEVLELKNAALNSDFEIRQEMSTIYTAMIRDLEKNFKNRLQDAEEQQEDMLEWSVKRVEDYYKEKLSKLSNRKRSRIDNGDETDDEFNIEELEAENAQLSAKVDSLKKTVHEMRESKDKMMVENNQYKFELSLVKKDLQNCRNLLEAAQKDIGGGAEAVVDELRKQLAAREEQNKSLKQYLNEAKEEFLRVQKIETELEESLKQKNEELLESSEKITDLTEQIEQANICLAENTKTVETLEDKLDSYAKKLLIVEENLQNTEDNWSKAVANNLVMSEKNNELKKMLEDQISSSKTILEKCNCVEQASILEKLTKELSQLREEVDVSKSDNLSKDDNLESINYKFLESQKENTSLKLRLAQSIEETKLLRDEVNLTKASLGDITEQINNLKVADSTKVATVTVDSQTSFINDDRIIETENLVCIKQEIIEHEEESLTDIGNDGDNELFEAVSNTQINSPILDNENNHPEADEKLAQLTIEFNELEKRCLSSDLRVEELCKELDETKKELLSVKASYDVEKEKILEYDDLLKSLKNKLSASDLELSKTKTELESFKKASVEAELALKTLETMATKCSTEHTDKIDKLEKEISTAKERDVIKEQLLDAHIQRITKLENDLLATAELREKLTDLEDTLKICNESKSRLEKQLEENCEKISTLENELQASITREQDKENETITLQKEMKIVIQNNNSKRDMEMEKEVKNALRDLTITQKALSDSEAALKSLKKSSEEKIERLEMRVQTYEKNASYLAMLQEGAEKKQAESEKLKILNDELKREIEEKNLELISFNKNRENTVQRYEALVKQLQEDGDRTKREVTRYQELFFGQATPTPRKEEIKKLKDELRSKTTLLEQVQDQLKKYESMKEEKENIVNTSDDESLETRRTRRRGRNNPPANTANDVSVIELSGSESKRVTRRTALAPPSTVPSVEKRKTRKKKLFAASDDTCVDVEQSESFSSPKPIIRSPLSLTRSLRNRRK